MNQQMKVGLFTAIGLGTIVISIFSLGSNKSFFQKSLIVHAYFDSAVGLNQGGIVSLAGVKVGNIENIEFDEMKNLVRVNFMVNQEFQKKVKMDSVVEIKTQGALGDKYLYITPGKGSDVVQDKTELKSEYGNDIFSVISKRSSDSEKLFDAISDLQILMKSLVNQNKIPALISKLDQTAGNLQETSNQIKKATANDRVNKTMNRVDSILEKIDNGQGTLGALINDRSLHVRMKSLLGAGEKQQQVKSILKSSVED
ncbi:MAG: MCE family protein [Moraxellaceae bacterium]|nr:MCE family protein [Pseudobdellovibrionaceae bacterium]